MGNNSMIKITERGRAGHFICEDRCTYHRNTLLSCTSTGKQVIVSTVGNYRQSHDSDMQQIGIGRYYETMAFEAKQEGPYLEADISKIVDFDSKWTICEITDDIDNVADAMHNSVVLEIIERMEQA